MHNFHALILIQAAITTAAILWAQSKSKTTARSIPSRMYFLCG